MLYTTLKNRAVRLVSRVNNFGLTSVVRATQFQAADIRAGVMRASTPPVVPAPPSWLSKPRPEEAPTVPRILDPRFIFPIDSPSRVSTLNVEPARYEAGSAAKAERSPALPSLPSEAMLSKTTPLPEIELPDSPTKQQPVRMRDEMEGKGDSEKMSRTHTGSGSETMCDDRSLLGRHDTTDRRRVRAAAKVHKRQGKDPTVPAVAN